MRRWTYVVASLLGLLVYLQLTDSYAEFLDLLILGLQAVLVLACGGFIIVVVPALAANVRDRFLRLWGKVRDRLRGVPPSPKVGGHEAVARSAEQPRHLREIALARLVAEQGQDILPLLDTLFDEEPALRPAVVLAWGRLKHAEALPRVAELIEGSDERLGETIAEVLANFDSPESEAALVACLGHPEYDVVWEAVDSLRGVGREPAREALEQLLSTTDAQGDGEEAALHRHITKTLEQVRRRAAGQGSLSLLPKVAGALSTVVKKTLPGGLSRAQEKRRKEGPPPAEPVVPWWILAGMTLVALLLGWGFGGTYTTTCQRSAVDAPPRCVRDWSFVGLRLERSEEFSLHGAHLDVRVYEDDEGGDVHKYNVVFVTEGKGISLHDYWIQAGHFTRKKMARQAEEIQSYATGTSLEVRQFSQTKWFITLLVLGVVPSVPVLAVANIVRSRRRKAWIRLHGEDD